MVVLIKRYANRKLYNTESSRYITLKGISELLSENRDIKVVDNETGQDITNVVLSQILVDDQKKGDSDPGVPGRVLGELLSRGGDAIYGVFKRSIDDVQDNITEARDNVKRWIHVRPEFEGIEISRAVNQAVERVLRVVDIPTRADVEALNKNLERLSTALEAFETRLGRLEK